MIALVLLLLLAQEVPLTATYWSTLASTGTYVRADNLTDGQLFFDFPRVDSFRPHTGGPAIGYLQTFAFPALYEESILILSGQVLTSGAPEFNFALEAGNTCEGEATFRLIINTGGAGEFDRWWSAAAFSLPKIAKNARAGRFRLRVPLAALWTSVYAKSNADNPEQFAAALRRARYIGITFGGGCFAGHGVNVSGGNARFVVTGLAVLVDSPSDSPSASSRAQGPSGSQ